MELRDKDLISVQETRNLLAEAKDAQKELARMDQQQIDRIVKAISDAGAGSAEHLAKMANEETGFGIWQDKVIKNLFASKMKRQSGLFTKTEKEKYGILVFRLV